MERDGDVWSVTSFNELQRDGVAARRWNMLHPQETPRALVRRAVPAKAAAGPGIAATDYIRTFAEQIRPFVGRRYVALGTDGYGRSDFRRKLREFFEVDRHFVTIAALRALADEGTIPTRRRSRRRSRNTTSIPTSRIRSPCERR